MNEGEMYKSNKEEILQRQMCGVLQQLVENKKEQRAIEERLLHVLSQPTHRQWLHERILDQYKHEQILLEIVTLWFGYEKVELRKTATVGLTKGSLEEELRKRLEDIESNILCMNKITQVIDDFELYKKINSILCDEYVYQNRLLRIICE
jgi:hypothetical protein